MTTVREFAIAQSSPGGGCTTEGLKGLDQQIVDLLLPAVKDKLISCADLVTVVGGSTIALIQTPGRDALAQAVQEKGEKPNLIHAYRTIAQQFVLFQWFKNGKCGIPLAAHPGTSPHEKGIGIDIQEHAKWRSVLEKHNWRWRGPADPGHFTFIGSGIQSDILTEGVRAFQRLWNLHNPNDHIKEDGIFGEIETAPRLLKSPIGGF
jgi:N-acetylmuramoyl-L-alanine amidase